MVIDENTQDEMRCTLNAAGTFRVADYVEEFRDKHHKQAWSDIVWNKTTSFRVNAFVWRVYRGAIAVDNNIQRRGVPFTSRCVCCQNPTIETLDHLLVKSDMAHSVWDHFAQKLHKPSRMRSIAQLHKSWLDGVSRRTQLGMTIMATLFYGMWEIWKTRCTLKYDEGRFEAQALLRRVYNHVYDCTRVMQPKREPSNFQKICLEEVKCPILEVTIKRGTWWKWMPPDPGNSSLTWMALGKEVLVVEAD